MRCILIFILLVFTGRLFSQQRPAEHAALHYRIVGFVQPNLPEGLHVLEISADSSGNTDGFLQHIIVKKQFSGSRVIAELPAFGRKYTWRITTAGQKEYPEGNIHHFTVSYSPYTDTLLYRMRVTQQAKKYANGYYFHDGSLSLYNMKGEAVWYVPSLDSGEYPNVGVRDLKMTPNHTISLLYRDMPYEIDWDGNILWKGPNTGEVSGDTAERYHHEFTITKGGRYMVLGNERVRPGRPDQGAQLMFGTIIEYDKSGKVKWSWRSANHYENTAYNYARASQEFYDIHLNSFYFDERRNHIFLSYKTISQVLEVQYPSGKVEHVFGKDFEGPDKGTNSMFYEQHSVKADADGNLLLFNNHNKNGTLKDFTPRISLYQPIKGTRNKLKLLWEYAYTPEKSYLNIPPIVLTNGGSVEELADRSYFVAMCAPYYGMFIVGKDKKQYWSAYGQVYNKPNASWGYNFQYRSSLIPSNTELERIILSR